MPNLPSQRPQYSPRVLVVRVQEILRREDIPTALDARNAATAVHAAADLLRALHVTPTNAPLRDGATNRQR